MRYYVVYKESLEELIKEVNRLMGEGWRPQGGIDVPAVTFGEGLIQRVAERFAQAMVRDTEEPPARSSSTSVPARAAG
jgi:hypothetical protein